MTDSFVKIVIDRFEEMLLKEVDRFVYGSGNICPNALYDRLEECIKAREELGYDSVPKTVKELLDSYKYDDDYIEQFLTKAQNHTPEECPEP